MTYLLQAPGECVLPLRGSAGRRRLSSRHRASLHLVIRASCDCKKRPGPGTQCPLDLLLSPTYSKTLVYVMDINRCEWHLAFAFKCHLRDYTYDKGILLKCTLHKYRHWNHALIMPQQRFLSCGKVTKKLLTDHVTVPQELHQANPGITNDLTSRIFLISLRPPKAPAFGHRNWNKLEKLPPYRRPFSSSCGELQPSAANSGALRAHFFQDYFEIFREHFFPILFSCKFFLAKFCADEFIRTNFFLGIFFRDFLSSKFLWANFFGEFFLGEFL